MTNKNVDKFREEIESILLARVEPKLVSDLLDSFLSIRNDVLTGTLERSGPGKFVETVVQVLQFLETGAYDQKPDVDKFLRELETRTTSLEDSLKLIVSRVSRSVYAFRNKRSIGHKNEIDPNLMDLGFVFGSCQWILAEFVRLFSSKSSDESESLIKAIELPPSPVVEEFGDFKTVLVRKLKPTEEFLILLFSYYPSVVSWDQIRKDMKRTSKMKVAGTAGMLYTKALIEGSTTEGYKLTSTGYKIAKDLIIKLEGKS